MKFCPKKNFSAGTELRKIDPWSRRFFSLKFLDRRFVSSFSGK
jgi:hypothetical protein